MISAAGNSGGKIGLRLIGNVAALEPQICGESAA